MTLGLSREYGSGRRANQWAAATDVLHQSRVPLVKKSSVNSRLDQDIKQLASFAPLQARSSFIRPPSEHRDQTENTADRLQRYRYGSSAQNEPGIGGAVGGKGGQGGLRGVQRVKKPPKPLDPALDAILFPKPVPADPATSSDSYIIQTPPHIAHPHAQHDPPFDTGQHTFSFKQNPTWSQPHQPYFDHGDTGSPQGQQQTYQDQAHHYQQRQHNMQGWAQAHQNANLDHLPSQLPASGVSNVIRPPPGHLPNFAIQDPLTGQWTVLGPYPHPGLAQAHTAQLPTWIPPAVNPSLQLYHTARQMQPAYQASAGIHPPSDQYPGQPAIDVSHPLQAQAPQARQTPKFSFIRPPRSARSSSRIEYRDALPAAEPPMDALTIQLSSEMSQCAQQHAVLPTTMMVPSSLVEAYERLETPTRPPKSMLDSVPRRVHSNRPGHREASDGLAEYGYQSELSGEDYDVEETRIRSGIPPPMQSSEPGLYHPSGVGMGLKPNTDGGSMMGHTHQVTHSRPAEGQRRGTHRSPRTAPQEEVPRHASHESKWYTIDGDDSDVEIRYIKEPHLSTRHHQRRRRVVYMPYPKSPSRRSHSASAHGVPHKRHNIARSHRSPNRRVPHKQVPELTVPSQCGKGVRTAQSDTDTDTDTDTDDQTESSSTCSSSATEVTSPSDTPSSASRSPSPDRLVPITQGALSSEYDIPPELQHQASPHRRLRRGRALSMSGQTTRSKSVPLPIELRPRDSQGKFLAYAGTRDDPLGNGRSEEVMEEGDGEEIEGFSSPSPEELLWAQRLEEEEMAARQDRVPTEGRSKRQTSRRGLDDEIEVDGEMGTCMEEVMDKTDTDEVEQVESASSSTLVLVPPTPNGTSDEPRAGPETSSTISVDEVGSLVEGKAQHLPTIKKGTIGPAVRKSAMRRSKGAGCKSGKRVRWKASQELVQVEGGATLPMRPPRPDPGPTKSNAKGRLPQSQRRGIGQPTASRSLAVKQTGEEEKARGDSGGKGQNRLPEGWMQSPDQGPVRPQPPPQTQPTSHGGPTFNNSRSSTASNSARLDAARPRPNTNEPGGYQAYQPTAPPDRADGGDTRTGNDAGGASEAVPKGSTSAFGEGFFAGSGETGFNIWRDEY